MKHRLYFVAVVPPDEIQREVVQFKKFAAQHFKSIHALKSPPHITVIPPFWWNPDRINEIIDGLTSIVCQMPPFDVLLHGFGCFVPRVIYIDVGKSPPLADLHRGLKDLYLRQWNLRPDKRDQYHPHMTIAFKDLSKSQFYLAWDYFKNKIYQANFDANTISLLEHDGRRWHQHSVISFLEV
ncbi:MAG: 2'-5' RNA ligase family protein [Saprospiraceae bacterium]|nr:2'-5' RNA ligase family protein [Saprospiraceae bacterium]